MSAVLVALGWLLVLLLYLGFFVATTGRTDTAATRERQGSRHRRR
jgi:hypothetical protein